MKTTLRYPCPCCGYLTLFEAAPGTFAICPVCFWEDDGVQFEDPEFKGGANAVSLAEAKINFSKLSASSEAFIDQVRPPLDEEMPKGTFPEKR